VDFTITFFYTIWQVRLVYISGVYQAETFSECRKILHVSNFYQN